MGYLFRKLTLKKRRRARRIRRDQALAMAELARYPKHRDAPRHGLPGELVISLTSYPARFATLHLTVQTLLDQSVKADRILLWIAHGDIDQLPPEVRAFEDGRFEVRACDDLRNFKKILPTFASYPSAFILICDDDSYYPDDWLKGLVDHFDPADPAIICHRAHQVRRGRDGELAPYNSWPRNVAAPWTAGRRRDLLPTGNGGVLYPPGALPAETGDLDLIRQLSSTSDDVWLFFMGRKAGFPVSRAPGPRRNFLEWPDTQAQALWTFHREGKKDEHLRDMARHFGTP